MNFITLSLAATAASAAVLQKRCSPISDPELQDGHLPPVACWLSADPACQPFIPEGVRLLVDEPSNSVTVSGISDECVETILEEQRREREGERNYGWTENIGTMDTRFEGVLIISDMSDEIIDVYVGLVKGQWDSAGTGEIEETDELEEVPQEEEEVEETDQVEEPEETEGAEEPEETEGAEEADETGDGGDVEETEEGPSEAEEAEEADEEDEAEPTET